MTEFYIFLVISALFLLISLYYLDLLFFVSRERKRFEAKKDPAEYLSVLEKKQKKAKHRRKRNYYLYLICLAFCEDGKREKGKRLSAFLKRDALLGVKTEF